MLYKKLYVWVWFKTCSQIGKIIIRRLLLYSSRCRNMQLGESHADRATNTFFTARALLACLGCYRECRTSSLHEAALILVHVISLCSSFFCFSGFSFNDLRIAVNPSPPNELCSQKYSSLQFLIIYLPCRHLYSDLISCSIFTDNWFPWYGVYLARNECLFPIRVNGLPN